MASVILSVLETQSGNLPPVCMCCGDATRLTVEWRIGFGKSFVAQLPFCELHKNHFKWRSRCLAIGLPLTCFLVIAGGAISMTATWQLPDRPPGYLLYLGILLLCLSLVVLVVSFGGIVTLWLKGIKITVLIDGNVTCYGVAPAP